MPISTLQKADLAFKKLVGMGETDATGNKQYYLEEQSPMIVDANNVLIDRLNLPSVAPNSPAPNTMYDIDGNITTDSSVAVIQYIEEQADLVTGRTESYILSNGGRIIPFYMYDGAYAPSFYDTTGAVIPFGTNSFYFDADAGIFIFFDGLPSNVGYITVKGWRYIGKTASNTIGGANITTKNVLVTSESVPTDGVYTPATKTFTFTHNFDTSVYNAELYNDSGVIGVSFIKSDNTIEFSMSDTPLDSHNIRLRLVLIA